MRPRKLWSADYFTAQYCTVLGLRFQEENCSLRKYTLRTHCWHPLIWGCLSLHFPTHCFNYHLIQYISSPRLNRNGHYELTFITDKGKWNPHAYNQLRFGSDSILSAFHFPRLRFRHVIRPKILPSHRLLKSHSRPQIWKTKLCFNTFTVRVTIHCEWNSIW